MWEELKSATEGLVHALGDVGLTNILMGLGHALTFVINLFSKLLNLVTKISETIGGWIGSGFGWLLAKLDKLNNLPNQTRITPEKAAEFWENERRKEQFRNEIRMQLDINDKNNNVGNVQATTKGGNLTMNVGRSSRGENK